ncbi:MAG: hypothetical protein A3F10_00195 [Coxiella sp. RIFCSPHIGHO2_12_FULL_42_15]|nr:MAG: hypothetical protein A3F10_00195 [Coxiella sp. RIFCSPHIGHO2_12_FULL_42_15]
MEIFCKGQFSVAYEVRISLDISHRTAMAGMPPAGIPEVPRQAARNQVELFIDGEYSCWMLIRRAYKFRLRPNPRQGSLLIDFSGQARFVWNKALSLNLERLKNERRILYYQEPDFLSKPWKKSEE